MSEVVHSLHDLSGVTGLGVQYPGDVPDRWKLFYAGTFESGGSQS
jgi:hypothetical protein